MRSSPTPAAPVAALDEKTGDCPRCRKSLEAVAVGSDRFDACSHCDGLWMGSAQFEAVCAERERQSAVLGFIRGRPKHPQQLTKINYVPCPQCGALMNRSNFARASGVIVDICKRHGVWFDADELTTIIEFIRKGGMEIARQRELNAIVSEREKLRDEQHRASRGKSVFGSRAEDDDARSFIRSLFDL